ncbi:MAG: hypothetical protein R3E95_07705 [Thiolinea sp.]
MLETIVNTAINSMDLQYISITDNLGNRIVEKGEPLNNDQGIRSDIVHTDPTSAQQKVVGHLELVFNPLSRNPLNFLLTLMAMAFLLCCCWQFSCT